MKILLLFGLFLFYGCLESGTSVAHRECSSVVECKNGLACDTSVCVHPCEIEKYCGDGVCVKDPEINGKAQYHCECAENMKKKVECCQEKEYCSNLGVYYTEIDKDPNYYCYISIGCFELPSYCYESSDCTGYTEYVNNEIMGFGVCNPNHECQLRCENDNDCIGENEYCHKTEKTCYFGIDLYPCDGGYFSAVEQKCIDYCTNDEQCSEPISKCDNSRGNCVLPCTTDEECTNFKFSGGPLCDIGRGHCSEAIKCTSDTDCHSPVSKCDVEEGWCMVACTTDEDCANGRYKTCNTEKGFCDYF